MFSAVFTVSGSISFYVFYTAGASVVPCTLTLYECYRKKL